MVMKRPMVAFLIELLASLRSRYSRRAQLEAENVLIRHQLIVLRRRRPGACEPVEPRSPAAGLVVLTVFGPAGRDPHCPTKDGDSLASTWFSAPTGAGSPVTYAAGHG